MTGKTYSGTYTSTILLTNTQQNPIRLTGTIHASGSTAASDSGFYSNTDFAWNITNMGGITATGATSYGIALLHGGTITNGTAGAAGGTILADETGIFITGDTASVSNFGSITGTAGRAVFLQDGGTLTNGAANDTTASILGGFQGVAIYNDGATLTNFGTIRCTGTAGFGVEMYGGLATNMAGGQIGGIYGLGFVGASGSGTLINAGTITGSARDGVELSYGGTVTNSGSIDGAIAGILGLYGPATLVNSGTVTGTYAAADLLSGGTITNQAGGTFAGGIGITIGNGNTASSTGTVTNAGIIRASLYTGVFLAAGGSLTNSGTIYGKGAGAFAAYGAGTIVNSGSIGAAVIGVRLGTGGSLRNTAAGTITSTGTEAVLISNGPLSGTIGPATTFTNAGVVTGGSIGVKILTNSLFTNQASGTISGGQYGAYVESVGGTISNNGLIAGKIGFYGRKVVSGSHQYLDAFTLINAGTINGSSGLAVSLFSSHDLLIDEPGAVFGGAVNGGGGGLELAAGNGTIGAVATSLASFSTITIDAGATWTLGGSMNATGTLLGAGTAIDPSGAVRLAGTVAGTGTLLLQHGDVTIVPGSIGTGETVVFTAPSTRLSLYKPLLDTSLHVGFAAGQTIYLPNQPDTNLSKSYSSTGNHGTLTLSQAGSIVAALAFQGTYTASSFALATDSSGGTDITIPCFAGGTRILTEHGPVAIEHLGAGINILTAAGALRPIRWLGTCEVDILHHARPAEVTPIRIAADAVGPGIPERDLLLSPDHAIFHAGALIPVRLLINGTTIRPEPRSLIRYHHLELDTHDVVLAENLPAESYLDDGNRAVLGLACPRSPASRCAPLILGGAALARARRHLATQVPPRPTSPVRLRAGGNDLLPARMTANRAWFLLPPHCTEAQLIGNPIKVIAALLDGVPLGGVWAWHLGAANHPRTLELHLA